MHNQRTVGLLEKVSSDLRLFFTCRQTYYSLKESTARINQQFKAESDFNTSVRRLYRFTQVLLKQNGLNPNIADSLTTLLSTHFKSQIDSKYKKTFQQHQSKCRAAILLNLKLRATDQNRSGWSRREIAGFECILRSLTGCICSSGVESELQRIRKNPFSTKVAADAISAFLTEMYQTNIVSDKKRN